MVRGCLLAGLIPRKDKGAGRDELAVLLSRIGIGDDGDSRRDLDRIFSGERLACLAEIGADIVAKLVGNRHIHGLVGELDLASIDSVERVEGATTCVCHVFANELDSGFVRQRVELALGCDGQCAQRSCLPVCE